MTPQQERQIDQLQDHLWGSGYVVMMEPIAGEEEAFIAALRDGLRRVEEVLAHNARTHGMRGKSKRAMAALHRDLPQPTWGVEISQGIAR